MLLFFALSPELWSCGHWVVACQDTASVEFCTKPGLSTVKPKALQRQSASGLYLWLQIHWRHVSNMVFSSLKGLLVQDQIVWLSISRTRIRVFATLLTNLLPVFLMPEYSLRALEEQPQWFFPGLFGGCSYWLTKDSSLVRESKMFNDHF